MYKLSTFLFIVFLSITFLSLNYAQTSIFAENFDSYTVGVGVACSNPTVWTTWSNAPCGSEDALVSNTYSYSASNSAKVIFNNDLVKDFGTPYSAGKYKISFQVYIPATKAGYFNTLASFAGSSSAWAIEVYFDAGGAGRVNPSGSVPATFTWTAGQWNLVEHVVDLDNDFGELYFNGVLIHSQQYTIGAYTSAVPLTLDANDFYGATASDEMYFDNYALDDMTAPPPIFFDDFDSYTAGLGLIAQNPVDYLGWSGIPSDDPLISTAFASSAPNAVNVISANDLVHPIGPYTTGKYSISFDLYIVNGNTAYFNTLNTWPATLNGHWAMQVYFNAGGQGNMDAGGALIAPFTYPYDTWMNVKVIADLNNDIGEVWLDGVMLHTWQWSLGTFGTGFLSLGANDFYGRGAPDPIDNYYFDNYTIEDMTVVPVELSAFTANVNDGNVVLNWTTETELNNQGFEIERRTAESEFTTIGHIQGYGTTTERKQYSFTDASVESGKYFYRLKQVDYNGTYEYSNEVFAEIIALPAEFVLDQNYPNPFNPTTSINFSIAEPTFVKLAVYNLLGEVVQVLKNENMTAGSYKVTFEAASLPSGMYLYKIETPQFTSVRKMMLTK